MDAAVGAGASRRLRTCPSFEAKSPLRRGTTRRSVARSAAGVGERGAGFGDELPVVAGRMKRELEDAERVVVYHLAVYARRVHDRVFFSPRTNDEAPDAV